MHRPERRAQLVAGVMLFAVILTGCSGPAPQWVDQETSYSEESALALAQRLDAGSLTKQSTESGTGLRHEALAALRRDGSAASDAAKLITRTFPSDTQAVPFYVELATYDSQPAYVIVEAVGPKDGKLVDKRLWVLSASGDVLLSGTR